MVLIFNHELAQDFLKCNVNIEKAFEYQLLYDWLGKGLLINDSADLWRERRKLLIPAFHQTILTEFVPIFNEKSDILVKRLADCVDIRGVNICDLVFPTALDIITGPDIYPEPLHFKPERFLNEGNSSRNPFAYLPFSAGVRNCIGQKFALIELKIVLAKVLLNYSFESLDPRDRIIEYNAIVSKPKGGLRVRVSHRSGV
ncbi:unnamed protein product [Oppiella nova]|uniref:Cytochrome P450 n=1 Tax=Oppiella nova TaxID=334625 RepID=A0A7R9LY22_9ACAR|nr:unnamed protein product [Oppiella nova]CAG2167396.1 unnamed protein product [Oppiella nova]